MMYIIVNSSLKKFTWGTPSPSRKSHHEPRHLSRMHCTITSSLREPAESPLCVDLQSINQIGDFVITEAFVHHFHPVNLTTRLGIRGWWFQGTFELDHGSYLQPCTKRLWTSRKGFVNYHPRTIRLGSQKYGRKTFCFQKTLEQEMKTFHVLRTRQPSSNLTSYWETISKPIPNPQHYNRYLFYSYFTSTRFNNDIYIYPIFVYCYSYMYIIYFWFACYGTWYCRKVLGSTLR